MHPLVEAGAHTPVDEESESGVSAESNELGQLDGTDGDRLPGRSPSITDTPQFWGDYRESSLDARIETLRRLVEEGGVLRRRAGLRLAGRRGRAPPAHGPPGRRRCSTRPRSRSLSRRLSRPSWRLRGMARGERAFRGTGRRAIAPQVRITSGREPRRVLSSRGAAPLPRSDRGTARSARARVAVLEGSFEITEAGRQEFQRTAVDVAIDHQLSLDASARACAPGVLAKIASIVDVARTPIDEDLRLKAEGSHRCWRRDDFESGRTLDAETLTLLLVDFSRALRANHGWPLPRASLALREIGSYMMSAERAARRPRKGGSERSGRTKRREERE